MKKRILSLAAMLICLVAAWAEDFTVGAIKYNITSTDNLTVEVTSGGEYSGEIVIPASVQYDGKTYSVTSIGKSAFEGCSELTSITIPSTVTSIGTSIIWIKASPSSKTGYGSKNPFSGCSSLASIIIESGNTVYDSRNNCNAIIITNTNKLIAGCQNTVIPNTLTSIESFAFVNCSGLTSVTIPSSVTSIADDAFLDCSGLTSIVVEEGNTVYNSRNDCNAIIKTSDNTLIVGCRNTVIPSSVTRIGNNTFYGCSGLTSVTIPSSVTSIGDRAFMSCSGLTSVTIPSSVTSIGREAFYGCSGLTSITIPSSVTSIGNGTFNGCSGLTSVTIPNSVTSIGNSVFHGCI